MIHRIVYLICFCFFTSLAIAQTPLKIGQWQAHYSYTDADYVAQSPTHFFYGNNQGILKIEKASNEIERISTVDGLSESGMGPIKYDPFNQLLIATYFNGNIDFLYDDESLYNLPFIATSDILGDRSINDILVHSDTTTYISMGFGLKVLNVRDQEFGDETRAGIPFRQVAVFNNQIYAATEEGIYFIPIDESVNIQDFSNWELLGGADFPSDYSTRNIALFNDQLYFDINDTIFRYDASALTYVFHEDDFATNYMTTEGENLLVGLICGDKTATAGSCNGKALLFDETGIINTFNQWDDCVNRPRYGVEDETGNIYFADNWALPRVFTNGTDKCDKYEINSPYDWRANEIVLVDDEIWFASEVTIPSNLAFSDNGFYIYKEGAWENYTPRNTEGLLGQKAVYRIAVNPDRTKAYIGTLWDDGLLEFDIETKEVKVIPNATAKLKPSLDENRYRVTGLEYDKAGNLWIAQNTNDPKGLVAMTPDGTFTDNFLSQPNSAVRKMVIDNEGFIWMGTDEGGLVIYDYNGTVNDRSDDRVRSITPQNSVLPDGQIYSLAVDLDGSVWVGTRNGAVVFECQGDPISANCTGSHPRVVVDDIPALLLDEVRVSAIAVDAANRKWFGTESGIFVQSPDGSERLATFDTDNSPLFSDIINDIAINQETGMVYVTTGNGIIFLKTDAARVTNNHSSNIVAYPNPVRPEYDGPIAIKGFARDSNIKITDITGKLVYETTALGGQAIWDGKDYNGRKAKSGVYLVYATRTSNRDNPTAAVAKILFMN